jgi:shikimate kinase
MPAVPHHEPEPASDVASQIKAALGQRSIVMIGLMGCGKTSVGRRTAHHLGLPFVDADEAIEQAAGKTIKEIFDDHGEAYFRDGERRVIARLLRSAPQVLATGGGAFLNPETRAAIAATGVAVWLKAELPVLMRRVSKRSNRPLLRSADPEAVMRNFMQVRYPIYAQAPITVESRDISHDAMANHVLVALAAHFAGPTPAPLENSNP